MFKTYPIWLRAIEGTESGGSAGVSEKPETGDGAGNDDGQESDDSGQVDWKARYEQAQQDAAQAQQDAEKWKAHSRKWEERAKAKNDADGDTSDIRTRLAEVEQDLKAARAEKERAEIERLKFALGAEFGLSKDDVDLLRGNEDEMRALAQRLGDKDAQRYPENPYQGRGSQGSVKKNAESWYAELTGKTS